MECWLVALLVHFSLLSVHLTITQRMTQRTARGQTFFMTFVTTCLIYIIFFAHVCSMMVFFFSYSIYVCSSLCMNVALYSIYARCMNVYVYLHVVRSLWFACTHKKRITENKEESAKYFHILLSCTSHDCMYIRYYLMCLIHV